MAQAEVILQGVQANGAGNIIIEKNLHKILFESNSSVVSYVSVDFQETIPCNLQNDFDSKPLLLASGINPNNLELARKRTHSHTYYDHTNKLKVSVTCSYNGSALSVSFSKKYYGE